MDRREFLATSAVVIGGAMIPSRRGSGDLYLLDRPDFSTSTEFHNAQVYFDAGDGWMFLGRAQKVIAEVTQSVEAWGDGPEDPNMQFVGGHERGEVRFEGLHATGTNLLDNHKAPLECELEGARKWSMYIGEFDEEEKHISPLLAKNMTLSLVTALVYTSEWVFLDDKAFFHVNPDDVTFNSRSFRQHHRENFPDMCRHMKEALRTNHGRGIA